MTPPAHIELAAGVVNLYIGDASAKRRLPTPGEQLCIDTVQAWLDGTRRTRRAELWLVQRGA